MAMVLGIVLGSALGFLIGISLGKREHKEWRIIGRVAGLALAVFVALGSITTSGEFLNPTALFITSCIVITIFLFPTNGRTVTEK